MSDYKCKKCSSRSKLDEITAAGEFHPLRKVLATNIKMLKKDEKRLLLFTENGFCEKHYDEEEKYLLNLFGLEV